MSSLDAAFMSSRLQKQISARILFSIGNPHLSVRKSRLTSAVGALPDVWRVNFFMTVLLAWIE